MSKNIVEHESSHNDNESESIVEPYTPASVVTSRQERSGKGDVPELEYDTGFWAWSSCIAAHFTLMNSWGLNSSFGLFQTYYTHLFDRPSSDITWIASMQIFSLFFLSTFTGRLVDAGYFRTVYAIGTILSLIGLFVTSICDSYWQVFLAQGICIGMGNACVFCPVLAVVSTYFREKRGLAFSIASTGSATGGLIFPLMAKGLLSRIGFAWTVRTMAFVQLVTYGLNNMILKPRVMKKAKAPWVDLAAFKELEYTFFASAIFFAFLGMYFGYYYLVSYATSQLDEKMTYANALNLLFVINGVGIVGRGLPTIMADRFGAVTLIIPFTFIGGLCMFIWISVKSAGSLYGWAAVYGIAAGAIQALFTTGLASLTKDPRKAGVRFGMICSTNGVAALIGPPIAGVIIRAQGGSFVAAQIFAGVMIVIGSCFFFASRYTEMSKTGVGWRAKI